MATCKDCENYELCVKAGNIGWMNIEQTKENHCGCYKDIWRKHMIAAHKQGRSSE